MPNYCFNRIGVHGASEDQITRFMEAVSGPNGPIDFETIDPVPDLVKHVQEGHCAFHVNDKLVTVKNWYERCDENGEICERRMLTDAEQDELTELETTSAYKWRCENWGCKWNAEGIEVDHQGSSVQYTFETPWSPPEPIIHYLRARFSDLQITAFFDEPLMLIGGYY